LELYTPGLPLVEAGGLEFFLKGGGSCGAGRRGGWQDYSGRLWDTLFLAASAFKRAGEKTLVPFEVIYQTDPRRSTTVALWPCFSEYEGFTILLPDEY